MTSDERAAVPADQEFVRVEGQQTTVWLRIATLKLQLAEQNLHVVSDADMRVLEAMVNKRIEQLRGTVNCRSEHADVCEAELARREGKR